MKVVIYLTNVLSVNEQNGVPDHHKTVERLHESHSHTTTPSSEPTKEKEVEQEHGHSKGRGSCLLTAV